MTFSEDIAKYDTADALYAVARKASDELRALRLRQRRAVEFLESVGATDPRSSGFIARRALERLENREHFTPTEPSTASTDAEESK